MWLNYSRHWTDFTRCCRLYVSKRDGLVASCFLLNVKLKGLWLTADIKLSWLSSAFMSVCLCVCLSWSIKDQRNIYSAFLWLGLLNVSHILTVFRDRLDHVPVSPSTPPCLPTSFFHSSSHLITLAASSFVKELHSCGAVKTSPPDVQSTWLEKDSGAHGGDWEAAADWYQLIKETLRTLCCFVFLLFFFWLAEAKPCDP